ncbi:MAG: ABC transporter permease subunit [Desulfosporosinus sp.]|nr:ABC transporter permease subunit [Desulfosporosinus sp.]
MRIWQNKLVKLFKVKKLYIFLLIIFANLVITVFVYKNSDGTGLRSIIRTANAQSLPLTFLNSWAQFMSIFISIYIADIITDEYKTGTLKLSLLRPVGRVKLFHSKILALIIFNVVMVALIVLLTYVFGILTFGWGDYTLYNGTNYYGAQGVLLTVAAYALIIVPYTAFGMIVIFIAVLSNDMTTTIIASVELSLIGQYFNAFESLKAFSIVNQIYFFHELFVKNHDLGQAVLGIGVNLAYIIVFYLLSVRAFKKKDIVF